MSRYRASRVARVDARHPLCQKKTTLPEPQLEFRAKGLGEQNKHQGQKRLNLPLTGLYLPLENFSHVTPQRKEKKKEGLRALVVWECNTVDRIEAKKKTKKHESLASWKLGCTAHTGMHTSWGSPPPPTLPHPIIYPAGREDVALANTIFPESINTGRDPLCTYSAVPRFWNKTENEQHARGAGRTGCRDCVRAELEICRGNGPWSCGEANDE